MIATAKVVWVTIEITAVGAAGAWSSRYLAAALQASGFTVSPDLVVQLVTTAVMVAIAYATLRSEVKATRESMKEQKDAHRELMSKVTDFEKIMNRVVTDLAVLKATAVQHETPQAHQKHGRHPRSDTEDV